MTPKAKLAKKASVGACLCALLGTAVLTGCGSSKSNGTASSQAATTSGSGSSSATTSVGTSTSSSAGAIPLFVGMQAITASPTVTLTKYKKSVAHPVIGFSISDEVNSFQIQRLKEAQMVAKQYGATLVVANANGDSGKQVSDIEDLLAQDVSALIVEPVTNDALTSVFARAARADIPVVAEGSQVPPSEVASQVYATNQEFGKVDGEGLCTALHGKGKVVMLRGIAGLQAEQERYQSGEEAMKACGLTIEGQAYGDWDETDAEKAMETLIAEYPTIDGVWSSGAEMTEGAIQVLQEHHRPLVPTNGECENGYLEIVQKDHINSTSPLYPTWQSPEAVKVALNILRGEPVKEQYNLQLPPITSANASLFINSSLSADWWSDGYYKDGKVINYLTPAQVREIFPS
jgi:ribose transport system substrate-binding protein